MTLVSLQCLALFLNKYSPTGRIADFGGTSKIGSQIVEKMLSLHNVSVIQTGNGIDSDGVDISVRGKERQTQQEYIVLDYDNGVDLMKPIKGKKFDAGISMDLLEHTQNPNVIAANISASLKRGAFLFVTVPWVWEIHNYPGDYYRFTPQGLADLFPKMRKISVDMVRDPSPEEELPRTRIVAVFKKI